MLTANRLSSSLFLFDQFVPGFRTKCSVTFCIRKARSSSLEILVCLHFGRKRVGSEAGRKLIEFVWTDVRTRTGICFAPLRSSLLSSPKSRWRLPSMTLRLLRDEKFPILERRTPELFPESAPSDIIGCLSADLLSLFLESPTEYKYAVRQIFHSSNNFFFNPCRLPN